MLRITRTEKDATVTVKFEGKLLADWVEEARRECNGTSESSARKRLDLSGLSFIDAAGAAFLKSLIERGVEIVACSHFVSEVLQMERKS